MREVLAVKLAWQIRWILLNFDVETPHFFIKWGLLLEGRGIDIEPIRIFKINLLFVSMHYKNTAAPTGISYRYS